MNEITFERTKRILISFEFIINNKIKVINKAGIPMEF
jgi:hypothetical protein